MADEADRTQERLESLSHLAVAASRQPVGPAPCGACHYCGEELPAPGARFCDTDCRDDYETELKAKRRAGN